jgi:hypothetical protein
MWQSAREEEIGTVGQAEQVAKAALSFDDRPFPFILLGLQLMPPCSKPEETLGISWQVRILEKKNRPFFR